MTKTTKPAAYWTNEKVAAQLFVLRMQSASNPAYAALLTRVIDRVEAAIEAK